MKRVFKNTAIAATLVASMISPASAEGWFQVRGVSVNTDTLDCRNWADDQMLQTNRGLMLFDLYKDGSLGPADQGWGFDLPKVCRYIVIHRGGGGGGGTGGTATLDESQARSAEQDPGETAGSAGSRSGVSANGG